VSGRDRRGASAAVRTMVYKLHFWPPYKHAAHYSGRTDKPPERFVDHANGRGARLTQVQVQAGGHWVVGLLEPGGAMRERQIKGHEAGRYCNVCKALKGYQAGKLDKEQALGDAGWDRASEFEQGLLLDIFGVDRSEIDTEKIPYVRPKPIVPLPEPKPLELTPELDAVVDGLIAGWTSSPKAEPEAEAELEAGL
jgi:predicted GIY-YIG superfamily endonuclease